MVLLVNLAAISIAIALISALINGFGIQAYGAIALGIVAYFAAKAGLSVAVGYMGGRQDAQKVKQYLADLPTHVRQDLIDNAPSDVKDRVDGALTAFKSARAGQKGLMYKPTRTVRVLIAIALTPIGIVSGFFATYIYVSAALLIIGIVSGDLENARFDPKMTLWFAFVSGFFLTFIPLRKWIYRVLHAHELRERSHAGQPRASINADKTKEATKKAIGPFVCSLLRLEFIGPSLATLLILLIVAGMIAAVVGK
jgi:hypothetical protein